MSEELNEVDSATNESIEETQEEVSQEESQEEVDYKAKYEEEAKAKSQILARAKKAESALKGSKSTTEKKESAEPTLSVKDSIALAKADISVDDIDDVLEFAKFKGMSVSDALSNNMVKTMLKDKEETRRTAEATSTNDGRRAPKQASANELLSNASKGNLPKDDADIARLADARIESKRKKSE
jgi:hypothetical protein